MKHPVHQQMSIYAILPLGGRKVKWLQLTGQGARLQHQLSHVNHGCSALSSASFSQLCSCCGLTAGARSLLIQSSPTEVHLSPSGRWAGSGLLLGMTTGANRQALLPWGLKRVRSDTATMQITPRTGSLFICGWSEHHTAELTSSL